jgi:hypothetical protein
MTTPDLAAQPAPRNVALRVHITLLVVQVIFGTFHVVGKAVLYEMQPLVLAGVRVGVAAPLLALYAWRHDRVVPRGRGGGGGWWRSTLGARTGRARGGGSCCTSRSSGGSA